MFFPILFFLIAYIAIFLVFGAFSEYCNIKEEHQIAFALFWPLTAIIYIIYFLIKQSIIFCKMIYILFKDITK